MFRTQQSIRNIEIAIQANHKNKKEIKRRKAHFYAHTHAHSFDALLLLLFSICSRLTCPIESKYAILMHK